MAAPPRSGLVSPLPQQPTSFFFVGSLLLTGLFLAGPPQASPAFARPALGPLERLIASRTTPSPISPCLASDAFDYYRVAELSTLVSSGALLRVQPETSYPTRRSVQNHESSRLFAPQIRAILAEEIAAGTTFLIGKSLPAEWLAPGSGLFVNPVGAVEKGSSTPENPKVRIIVDASSGGRGETASTPGSQNQLLTTKIRTSNRTYVTKSLLPPFSPRDLRRSTPSRT